MENKEIKSDIEELKSLTEGSYPAYENEASAS